MNIDSYLLEKLSTILFLEIKKGTKIGEYTFNDNVYLPVKSEDVVGKAKDGDDLKNIPVSLFTEGMFLVLGCDDKFRFNDTYKEFLSSLKESTKFIKGKIFNNVKNEKYENAYLLLRGLLKVEPSKDNYNKAFVLLQNLSERNKVFKEELLKKIEECKKIQDFSTPYLYEAIIKRDDKDFEGALFAINQYLALGGNENDDVLDLKSSLELITDYDKGKDLVNEDPKTALQILLPLLDELGDSAEIYYYIAVAYRNLENYEKAIYYLNEAQAINSDYIEVVNELGINYACLEDYNSAIKYFRAAFDVTKSIEICTNLIMCYLNIGDKKQAKLHLDIAKKLNPKDEILKEIEKIFN